MGTCAVERCSDSRNGKFAVFNISRLRTAADSLATQLTTFAKTATSFDSLEEVCCVFLYNVMSFVCHCGVFV